MNNKKFKEFWNEVEQATKSNNIHPNKIDENDDPADICEIFSNKYKNILAKQQNPNHERICKINASDREKVGFLLRFSISDVKRAISRLKPGIGFDDIHSNHLRLDSDLCHEVISMLFFSCMMHNHIPLSMLRGVISPLLKDRFGDLSCSDNYRPVMSSSIFLKVFEYCILEKIEPWVIINDRQHGFRSGHSTSSACLVLKETVLNYVNSNSDVHACFVDISKAFDSVNHKYLMKKLLHYGVPSMYVSLIEFWYNNQFVNVRYMSHLSAEWKISNGVRQGGILSSLFFNIYIDSLLERLSCLNIGCKLGILSSNVIAYADDIVLLAPSVGSLQMLIDLANSEALLLDLQFNFKKTKCMIFNAKMKRSKTDNVCPHKVDNHIIEYVSSFKYLGYMLSCNMSYEYDVNRLRSKFYVQFNSMLRNFHFADKKVKLFLFQQYCLQMYGCELWFGGTGSALALKQFAVGYHKAIKKILNLSYHESNHYACQEAQFFTFQHLVNKYKIMSAIRLLKNPCNYILKIMNYFVTSSSFLKEVYDILKKFYDLDSLLFNDKDAIIARICFVQNHEKQMREACLI